MNPKLKTLFFFLIGAFLGILVMYLFTNYKIEKKNQSEITAKQSDNKSDIFFNDDLPISGKGNIEKQTEEKSVISYVKSNHKLPDFYITKIGRAHV